MLSKRNDVRRLDPKKGVNKLFENVLRKGRIQNFFQRVGRALLFDIFFRQSYFE